jgi:precorrin-6A/cobalt-precorrin-6A reductase
MILLLGGTSETAPIAEAIAAAGYRVLVSTATDVPLLVGDHPSITLRRGPLDEAAMLALVRKHCIRAVIDATHPFASEARRTALHVAEHARITYLRYERPGVISETGDSRVHAGQEHGGNELAVQHDGIFVVASHDEAARVGCACSGPVLLTVGSRSLHVYAKQARQSGVRLVARVLDHAESWRAAHESGLSDEDLIIGRGPFTVEQNRELIRRCGAKILITKDSGAAGGVHDKLEAARLEGCHVVIVAKPRPMSAGIFSCVDELIGELQRFVPARSNLAIALDLESVLVPEIWGAVAQASGIDELRLTTRDIPDYALLMQRRIQVCRQHGLTLMRLREIVSSIEPLPGAVDFLAWAQAYALTFIISDTFHELAGPMMERLNCPFMACNWLTLDREGYISSYQSRHEHGKVDVITYLQRFGSRVLAVGDSYNDMAMLHAADAGFLFRPSPRLNTGDATNFPTLFSFAELQVALRRASAED